MLTQASEHHNVICNVYATEIPYSRLGMSEKQTGNVEENQRMLVAGVTFDELDSENRDGEEKAPKCRRCLVQRENRVQ